MLNFFTNLYSEGNNKIESRKDKINARQRKRDRLDKDNTNKNNPYIVHN